MPTNKLPLFSICIPTYNRAHLLPTAIESVLRQTCNDYELVIVDNASTDNTRDVLNTYTDDRIRIINNPATVSMAQNHNICAEHAKGKWLTYLHSDDSLGSRFLINRKQAIERFPGIAVWSPHRHPEQSHSISPTISGGIAGLVSFLRSPHAAPSGMLYDANCLRRFKFATEGYAFDLDFLCKVFQSHEKIGFLNDGTVNVVTSNEQYSSKWVLSGQFYIDVAAIIDPILENYETKCCLIGSLVVWRASEMIVLLRFLLHTRHQDVIEHLIDRLTEIDSHNGSHKYHYQVYKTFGRSNYEKIFSLIRRLKLLKISN